MRPLAVPDGNVPSEIIPVFILPRFFRFVKIRSQNFFRFRLKFFQSFPSADPQQKPNVPRRQQNTFRLPSPVLDCVFGFLYPRKRHFSAGEYVASQIAFHIQKTVPNIARKAERTVLRREQTHITERKTLIGGKKTFRHGILFRIAVREAPPRRISLSPLFSRILSTVFRTPQPLSADGKIKSATKS